MLLTITIILAVTIALAALEIGFFWRADDRRRIPERRVTECLEVRTEVHNSRRRRRRSPLVRRPGSPQRRSRVATRHNQG